MRSSPSRADARLQYVLRAGGLLSAAIVVLVLVMLLREAVPTFARIAPWRFLTDPGWHPAPDGAGGAFAIGSMLAGSVAATIGALLIAGPCGVLSAIFCRFYAPPAIAGLHRRVVELLAGIPSVVYGFWGLVTLAPIVRTLQPPGTSLLTGVLVLSIMILPTVTLLSEAALRNVPGTLLRGGAALGLSRWSIATRIALPAARSGVGLALVLATARAIGETMAVLMVCGNVAAMPASVFDPVRTLTANIALELGYASGDHRGALYVSGLALMVLVVGLVLLADRLRGRVPLHA